MTASSTTSTSRSYENVLVSLDGHTEGFVDFRPYMPSEWHERFETAREHGRAVFNRAEQYFARLDRGRLRLLVRDRVGLGIRSRAV